MSTSPMEDNNCPICWNEMKDNITTLTCNHCFHTECLDTWRLTSTSCPYCRSSMIQDRIPIPEDEIIVPDGNIEILNEHNYFYFYYLQENVFNIGAVLHNISQIKKAKLLKSALRINNYYNIKGLGVGEWCSNRGKLVKICQITYDGIFACHFMTEKGLEVYHTSYHTFESS